MQTKRIYEKMALKELREIPGESLPQVIKILRSLKQSILTARSMEQGKTQRSGLCGIWKDSRRDEEIIEDIYSHRSGFGGRSIEL